MAGTFITSEREKIYIEDVQNRASVSESVGNKLGAAINFIMDNIVQKLQFGVVGNYFSGLTAYPYTFAEATEIVAEPYLIQRLVVSLELSGTAGQTEFRLERQLAAGGSWDNMFSTNCIISNTATDMITFNSDDVSAPAGVTLPVLAITSLAKGDKIRMVLITAGTQARNLIASLDCSPT